MPLRVAAYPSTSPYFGLSILRAIRVATPGLVGGQVAALHLYMVPFST